MSRFLEIGDDNETVFEDDLWKIVKRCNKGYKPWHTLHKKRTFLNFTWWSGMKNWGDFEALKGFIDRFNNINHPNK